MITKLAGKVALISGSTSGIGLATAKVLAGEGAHICLNGFGDINEIEKIRQGIQDQYNVKCVYVNSDLSNKEGVYQLVDECTNQLGPIDVLINNVGMQHICPIEEFPDDIYHKVVELNLNSYFYAIKKVIPHMKQQDWGRIVNIASVHGLVGSVWKTPYVSAKHGVLGMTKVAGLELANTGVSINALCPGFVYTDLIKTQIQKVAADQKIPYEQAKEELLRPKQPNLHAIPPEDIGRAVLFLCSETAGYMKGTHIAVDGGWTAQ